MDTNQEPGPKESCSLTSSTEPEIFESWTMVSEESLSKSTPVISESYKVEAGDNMDNLQLLKNQDGDGDISDGISIISDNESAGRSSPQPPHQTYPPQNSSGDDHNNITNSGVDPISFYDPLAPPNTPDGTNRLDMPNVRHESIISNDTQLDENQAELPGLNIRCVFYLSVFIAVIAFISKLRTPEWNDNLKISDMNELLQRIEKLEIRNNDLEMVVNRISRDIQKYETLYNDYNRRRVAEKYTSKVLRDKRYSTRTDPRRETISNEACEKRISENDEESIDTDATPGNVEQQEKFNNGRPNQKWKNDHKDIKKNKGFKKVKNNGQQSSEECKIYDPNSYTDNLDKEELLNEIKVDTKYDNKSKKSKRDNGSNRAEWNMKKNKNRKNCEAEDVEKVKNVEKKQKHHDTEGSGRKMSEEENKQDFRNGNQRKMENGKKYNQKESKIHEKTEEYEKREQIKSRKMNNNRYSEDNDKCTSSNSNSGNSNNKNSDRKPAVDKNCNDNNENLSADDEFSWHEKMMRQREEARTKNSESPSSQSENWYLERGTARKAAREHEPETDRETPSKHRERK